MHVIKAAPGAIQDERFGCTEAMGRGSSIMFYLSFVSREVSRKERGTSVEENGYVSRSPER